jgi:hypothetical protein
MEDLTNFVTHIKMRNSGSVKVEGCEFSSIAPQSLNAPSSNIGIRVSNTSLTVTEYCPPNSPVSPDGKCMYGVPTTFSGFYNGIYASNSGASPTFKVSYSNFNDNLYSIYIDGINNHALLRNIFTLTQNSSGGVCVFNSTGYKIEENKFYGTPPKTTVGLHINNSGSAENEVYLNEFHNLRIGQRFVGKNSSLVDTVYIWQQDTLIIIIQRSTPPVSGLQTICNTFINSQFRDILVGYERQSNIYTVLSIKNLQGSMLMPAGNKFSSALSVPYPHFENKSQHLIDYYLATTSTETPRTLGRMSLHGVKISNSCPSKIGISGGSDTRGGDLAQYDEWNAEYEYWLAQWNEVCGEEGQKGEGAKGRNLPSVLTDGQEEETNEDCEYILQMVSYYSALKDNYFNSIIVDEMNNEDEGVKGRKGERIKSPSNIEGVDGEAGRGSLYENLRYLFNYRNNYTDNLSIAETYLAENNYNEALFALNKIYQQFELTEEQNAELQGLQIYTHWLQQLEDAGNNIYELSDKEILYLVNFVETNIGRGKVFVNNILCALYNICLDEENGEKGEGAKGRRDEEAKGDGIKSPSNVEGVPEGRGSLLDKITLTPNPTTGELRVTSYELQVTSVEVFDVYGRKHEGAKRRKGEGAKGFVMDISDLPTGIYFVKIYTESNNIIKKIVKQ